MVTKMLLTSDEFADIIGHLPEDRRYELIRGEIYEMGGVTSRHGETAVEFGRRLGNWNAETKAGRVSVETGYTLERSPDTVRVPDIAFVAKGRILKGQGRRGYMDLAPDLIVEVRSPNDSWPSLVDRADTFFAAGTRIAMLVEPDEFVEVRRPGQEPIKLGLNDVFECEDVLPGFRCRVGDFFPEEL